MSCGQPTTLYFLRFERDDVLLGACCVFGCCFPSAVVEAGNQNLVPVRSADHQPFVAVGRRIFPPLIGRVPPELVGVALTREQAESVDWDAIKEVRCS